MAWPKSLREIVDYTQPVMVALTFIEGKYTEYVTTGYVHISSGDEMVTWKYRKKYRSCSDYRMFKLDSSPDHQFYM